MTMPRSTHFQNEPEILKFHKELNPIFREGALVKLDRHRLDVLEMPIVAITDHESILEAEFISFPEGEDVYMLYVNSFSINDSYYYGCSRPCHAGTSIYHRFIYKNIIVRLMDDFCRDPGQSGVKPFFIVVS